MVKVAVIGDKDSVYGFAALGLDIYPCVDVVEAISALKKLVQNGYGVIYMVEAFYSGMNDEIDRYRNVELPAIIPIPGMYGNTGIGMNEVSRSVEKAVGSDILS